MRPVDEYGFIPRKTDEAMAAVRAFEEARDEVMAASQPEKPITAAEKRARAVWYARR